VTGASRGIGRAVAVALSAPETLILLNYKSSTFAAEEAASECRDKGADVRLVQLDVGDGDQVAEVLEPVIKEVGPLDVLVNNAGIARDSLLAWVKPEDWDAVMRVNLGGLYSVTRAAVRGMIRNRAGRIINMTSISGQRGNAGQTPYAASKAGIIGFTKALALELAPRKITVNAVAPGLIDTDMTADLPREELAKAIPMRRFGSPAEVAGAVRFLAGPDAAYITGQVLGVNGGFYT